MAVRQEAKLVPRNSRRPRRALNQMKVRILIVALALAVAVLAVN